MKSASSLLIFVVEDNEWYGGLLVHQLSQDPRHIVRRFTTAQACLDHLGERPAVVTLDYRLPDATGEAALQAIRERLPSAVVIVISSQEDITTAVALLRQGAHDYLVKDTHTFDRLRHVLERVAGPSYSAGTHLAGMPAIAGEHPSMQRLHTLIAKAAATTITVSISGETGTGKELVAQAIHQQSAQVERPFVAVNMAAIPHELLESELFGHEKGAFTGAVARRVGRFQEAHTGTLFLDEIGDLEIGLQAKLLRVLQERQLTPVGSNRMVPFDVRLIVATHRDLLTEVQAGRFREDLYYRLLGLPIAVPPLRTRGHDMLLLADAFVHDFCAQNQLPLRHLTPPARTRLLAYPFPGNVRELKAVVELAVVLAEGPNIGPEHLSLRPGPETPSAENATLRAQTVAIVQRCLHDLHGDVHAAANRLGVSRSTIYRLINSHDVRLD